MLLYNEKFLPEVIKGDKILEVFDKLNTKYDKIYADKISLKTPEEMKVS